MSEKGILKYIKEVMQDCDGAYSNKRLITTAAFVFMTISFFANLFWGFMISEYVFNAMATVVMAGLASNVGENFATAWVDRKKNEQFNPDDAPMVSHGPAQG
jgi:hypothetical protein